MTALINASTSSGVVVTSDTSGSLAFQSNGTSIATISSTGLTMNSGNIVVASTAAPAFSYGQSASGTSVSAATATKIVFDLKDFDTILMEKLEKSLESYDKRIELWNSARRN